ncbi:MAG: beta-propeller domain-containing protein [Deltaproteobacteria bacterium]|nr:beta-propeller domain-containing protein [Deltaproteobacteria bacterium]
MLKNPVATLLGVCLLLPNAFALNLSSSLTPQPAERDFPIEAQLKRFHGQTRFLNPGYTAYRKGGPVSAPRAGVPGDTSGGAEAAPKRAQQESDVFKVGKSGSKLLYLLNSYRGLQIVNFTEGTDKPKLVGRVPATGNYPSDMYFDESNDRLIVLERVWYDASGNYDYTTEQSRLLIYDVKNPAAPKIVQALGVDGEIADSRMVGDVLYVASALRPYWGAPASQKPKGFVYSIKLATGQLSVLQKQELALPASSRENMNIVEVNEAGQYKYFLVAVLSESGWGWWDRQSLVEVIDISDLKGAIKPLMVVSARGQIAKRAQTQIKNNVLIVTSNYRNEPGNWQSPERIAVETFKLPTEQNEVITEDEAQYRKMWIDHQLGRTTGEERERLEQKAAADSLMGIKGRFVRTAEGKLRKIMPDFAITVGDTTGQSAALQDVRYDGDLLHVFWVPQNQRDPFDLFDISHPENEIKYLKRLFFDGWIERSIPMTYQGRKFVLGLGWTVSNVNNEGNRRFPQAMLFEIVNSTGGSGSPRAVTVAQFTLAQANVWTNFGGQDKFVELHEKGDGTGDVMFAASSYTNGKSVSGGKLIGFDLNKAIAGDTDNVFTEGALLEGDEGWLKRVFTNPEIQKINTFSDMALGTFDVKNVGKATDTLKAMNILELARNIGAYVVLESNGIKRGLQIVTGSWWDGKHARTRLRLVPTNQADAELPAVLGEQVLKGSYMSSLVDRRDGSLWLATRVTRRLDVSDDGIVGITRASMPMPGRPPTVRYETRYFVYQLNLRGNADSIEVTNQVSWTGTPSAGHWYWYGGNAVQLVQLDSGEVLAKADNEIHQISDASGTLLKKIALDGCRAAGENEVTLQFIGNALYFTTKEPVTDGKRENLTFTRNFFAPLSIKAGVASCGNAINIPGKLVAVLDNRIVTDDDRVLDVVARKYGNDYTYYQTITANALDSLKLVGENATLVDDYDNGADRSRALKTVGQGKFGYIDFDRYETFRYYGENYRVPYTQLSNPRFVVLGLDAESRFTKEVFALPDDAITGAQLVEVFPDSAHGYLGVLSSGRKLQALRWSETNMRPVVQRLIPLDSNFQKQEAMSSVVLPGWYYSAYGQSSGIHYTAAERSMEATRGVHGIQQLLLE